MARGRGLYETLISEALASCLRQLDSRLEPDRESLRPAEAPDRIALHLGRVVQRALADVGEKERTRVGVALARDLIGRVASSLGAEDLLGDAPGAPVQTPHCRIT